MAFPGAIVSFAGFTSSHTLAADTHAAQHNSEQTEIVAVETKVGTGSSTPIVNTVLRGTGTGTSSWAQVALTTDVTGILPQANGGTGQTNLNGLTLSNPNITGTVTGGATYSAITLTTPIIADFSNANHNHSSAAQGGLLNGANAITDGTLTPNELVASTGASWVWQAYTPVLTGGSPNIGSTGTILGRYNQTGKTVNFQVQITESGSGISGGSGAYSVTLPVAAQTAFVIANGNPFIGNTNLYQSSGTLNFLGATQINSSTTAQVVLFTLTTVTTGAVFALGIWGSTVVGLATGNIVTISGTYEAV